MEEQFDIFQMLFLLWTKVKIYLGIDFYWIEWIRHAAIVPQKSFDHLKGILVDLEIAELVPQHWKSKFWIIFAVKL